MSRYLVVAALLLAATSAPAAEPQDQSVSPPWYKRLFGSSKPKEEAPPAPPAAVAPVPTWKDVSRSLDQERTVYMERLQYCTRLRQIAVETNDDNLLRKADELEEMAEAVYSKRTRALPAIVQDVKAAEAALDQRKPAGPPAGSVSAQRVVTGRAPNGRPTYSRE